MEVISDGGIVGLSIRPNADLAQAAVLTITDGVMVNGFLQTSKVDICAVGDLTNFYTLTRGMYLRIEHKDNINHRGKVAERNMAGARKHYDYLPFSYSDLSDLDFEAVGELNVCLVTDVDKKEPYRKGVVYHLKEKRISSVLSSNTWARCRPRGNRKSRKSSSCRNNYMIVFNDWKELIPILGDKFDAVANRLQTGYP